jgi:integrase
MGGIMRAISKIDFDKLIHSVDSYVWRFDTPLYAYFRARDKIMIKLAYYLGLRKGEVSHAHYGHINFSDHTFCVSQHITKTRTGRVMPIPDVFFAELVEYINKFHLFGYLFLSRNHNIHLDSYSIGIRFNIYRLASGLAFAVDINKAGHNMYNYRFHDLRATYATCLHKNRTDIKIIQNLLGHRRASSTFRYLGESDFEDRRLAVNKTFSTL